MSGSLSALATPEIKRVFRDKYGRAVAVLVRVFGDIDIAEEAVQEVFATTLQRWPSRGAPHFAPLGRLVA